jgi:ferredoxin-NADP reductase/MOSC domain-containing protein YiiM/ferredoxin
MAAAQRGGIRAQIDFILRNSTALTGYHSPVPRLISVNVGLPRDITWRGETVHTGIWKEPVRGRRMVRRLNVDGDGQGDLAGHGGEQRAVMVYQVDSYRHWESYLGRNDFTFGQFGENFTVEGLADDEVCIGDRYRIGGALFEVTQPRVTCYRLGIRMEEPEMAALLVSHHRPGFYFRVIEEGEIGANDEIKKVADGPERMSITEIDALLYLPDHPHGQLKRSLRIPALSSGWKSSLQALIEQKASATPGGGNAGLTAVAGPPPAWPGFRSLRVARVDRESASVISLSFETTDGSLLPTSRPGQFLVLKLQIKPEEPPILRNYSMSGAPEAGTYRVSIKHESNGIASTFLHNHITVGDIFGVSAPRGGFTLRPGDEPVVLLSAGIGATPVLAMLHALASAASHREVWWLYGARNRNDHPFARESRQLLKALARSRSYIAYSKPGPEDRLGENYDGPGHLSVPLLDRLGVPRSAAFYLCGPPPFLSDFTAGLKAWGIAASQLHTEIFGSEESVTPGIAARQRRPVHLPPGSAGPGPLITFIRSGIAVPWAPNFRSLLELAEACDVHVKWSCRTGVCHTCECALIGGAVVYQPDPLEPPAKANVLICCSQPLKDIEIDL